MHTTHTQTGETPVRTDQKPLDQDTLTDKFNETTWNDLEKHQKPYLEATFQEPKKLRAVLETIATVADDVQMYADSTGLYIRTLNSTDAVLIDVALPATTIDTLRTYRGGVVGLDIADVATYLKHHRNEPIILRINGPDNKITVEYKNSNRCFTTPCINPDAIRSVPKVPRLNRASVHLNTEELDNAIRRDIKPLKGEYVEAEIDTGNFVLHLFNDNEDPVYHKQFSLEEHVQTHRSRLDPKYLALFTSPRLKKQFGEVELRLGTDKPVSAVYDLGANGFMEIFAAPVIVND